VTPLALAINVPRRAVDGPPAVGSTGARAECKSLQEKPNKKAWTSLFFFGGIWPFQWVTEEKIKKFTTL
jgi:hypothetical protein